ncbi:MAG: ABC transporter ATP-binding protein [Lacipirellulaceae bacterium]
MTTQAAPPPTKAAQPAAIELVGVGKRYSSGAEALAGVDLRIERGEFVCLVGPSGCGKSTALRMMAGLSSPTAGRVTRAAGDPDSGGVGFVFQEPTLFPWSRVWENVYLPLRLRGESRRAARDAVDAAIESVGLAEFARAYPRQLSGGMKMRVSIARALVTRPALVLMDEPFAALDEQTRFRLNDDLLRLWGAARQTVVFVTHSVYESVYLAQRVVVMASRPGRVTDDIRVDAPHPRAESFRRDVRYGELCLRVSDALATASKEPAR